jgi:hypothetical protein
MGTNIIRKNGEVTGLTTMDEQGRAAVAKKRGQAASYIADPAQRQKFIAAQGEAEKNNSNTATAEDYSRLDREAEDTIATQGANKAIKSYKKGGKIKRTGIVKVHKGERVLNPKQTKKFEKMPAAMKVLGGQKAAR